MTRAILLVRHASHAEVGHVLSGRSEIALDAVGRAQADALGRMLARTRIDAIHASPRRRAVETATPLAARLAMAVHAAPALDEIDFGAFAGRGFAELDEDPDWRRWNAERARFRTPGGETMGEAARRARAFLDRLPPGAGACVCVSHCDVIRAVVCDVLGLGYDRMFAFDCDPASITELALGADGARLVRLNARAG